MFRTLALALVLPALPSAAQDWATFAHDAGRGAGICPVDDATTGNYFCFLISCPPDGGDLYLRVAFAGAGPVGDSPSLVIDVDGREEAAFTLEAIPHDTGEDFGIRIEPARDAALVEALSGGRIATLTVGEGDAEIIQEVSLAGSRAAIDRLPELCDR